jgi:hypothetical protein
MSLEELILYIFNREKKLTTFTLEIETKRKKTSACTGVLEKYFQKNFKNAKF